MSDFDIFRQSNCYYVDKTRYLAAIEKKGRYLFLIRPRRFGKSLFLGIMEACYLVQQVDTSMGIRDLITGEKEIQAFLNVYLGLSDLYLVYSERELGKGYADLVIEPFLAQYPQLKYSYLIEIKYINPRERRKPSPRQRSKRRAKKRRIN